MFKIINYSLIVLSSLWLNACSILNNDERINPDYVILEKPLEVSEIAQVEAIKLARSSEIMDLDAVGQAQVFYSLALAYEKLGLTIFNIGALGKAINLYPMEPSFYVYMGNILALEDKYAEAFEAFNSAIELEPNLTEVYGFRGLASIYANKVIVARDDLLKNYEIDKNDPYRILLLYFAETKLNDPNINPKSLLEERYNNITQTTKNIWMNEIIEVILGLKDEKEFWEHVLDGRDGDLRAEILCESYYYLGKYYELMGQKNKAQDYFKLSMMTNVVYFIEYRYSLKEINRFEKKQTVSID